MLARDLAYVLDVLNAARAVQTFMTSWIWTKFRPPFKFLSRVSSRNWNDWFRQLNPRYGHRLIDGAHAACFLRWVAQALEDPILLSL